MRRRSSPTVGGRGERAPRLVLRFATFTALGLAAAAAAILLVVRHGDTAQAERAAIARTSLVAEAVLSGVLRSSDLERRVGGKRRSQLERLFRERVLLGDIESATLYSSEGRVTFSVGRSAGSPEPAPERLREALGGPSSRTSGPAERRTAPRTRSSTRTSRSCSAERE